VADWQTNNMGAVIKSTCLIGGRLVAAGAGDGTALVAAGLDRKGFGSGKLIISGHCNNTAAKKLQITSVKLAYSDDNSSWSSDVEQLSASFDLCTGTGDAYGQYELDIDFTQQKRYVRVTYTPDSTASGTDVAETTAVMVLGGVMDGNVQSQPVTRSA
jgi:hypothetical protein